MALYGDGCGSVTEQCVVQLGEKRGSAWGWL